MQMRQYGNVPTVDYKAFITGIALWVRQGKTDIGPEIARVLQSHVSEGSWMEIYDEEKKEWRDVIVMLKEAGAKGLDGLEGNK